MATPWYCRREDVKDALDSKETARTNRQIDRAVESASRAVEGLLRRRFYPKLATRYFDWPNFQSAPPWRLWLDGNELISLTTLSSGGAAISASDYLLRRADDLDEPPYDQIQLDRSATAAFGGGSTPQQDIAVTGLWGYSNDEEEVGSLSGSLAASTSATASITWATADIGVGDILRIDSERMIVTGRSMVDSGQNLGTALTASKANTTVDVSTASAFALDEILLIDSERMRVVDISGDLTVIRAWDGSTLAAHSLGADIYTLTGIELDRAQLGTSIAAHSSSAVIYRWTPPGLVKDLCVAEALNQVLSEQAGYARTVGSGESERNASGAGLRDLRELARAEFGRARVRHAAV